MLPSLPTACPGLFYATSAQDGVLSRLRIPGGILNVEQCAAIASLADQFGGGYLDVTNRANVQIRASKTGIALETLRQLQAVGLAAEIAEVDAIRNIMSSPTAGIDRQESIDTRPFVTRWNRHIIQHPELSVLSAKFSVCFEGGGLVSVGDRPNDILFYATQNEFRLALGHGERGESPQDVGVQVHPDECLPILFALTNVYRQHSLDLLKADIDRRKPRLREVLNYLGVEQYLQAVAQQIRLRRSPLVPVPKQSTLQSGHLGVQPQRQAGLFYQGIALPLGRLETYQLRGLAALSAQYGSGEVRLTPWQNVLIPDLPERSLSPVQQGVEGLGLSESKNQLWGAIVACSGKAGCASSATETKQDAMAVADYLAKKITLDQPLNLHFSGCKKSCAQHTQSDITLLGVEKGKNSSEYDIYITSYNTEENTKFGQKIYQSIRPDHLPRLIEQMLKAYQAHRRKSSESWREFTERHTIAQLRQLLG